MKVDSTWLRCPNCFLDLAPVGDRTIGCAGGHRFDEAKQGYVTLLPPKAPRTIGDDRVMLDSRAALLTSGLFAPIAETASVLAGEVLRARTSPALADLGCGTGYYADAIAARHPNLRVLLGDRSPEAVRLSTRSLRDRVPNATGVVLDLWRPLPLRDGVADVILDVFAPRNPPEFARVLAPGGRLIVVVPTERHLRELRATGALLDIPEGKADQVIASFGSHGLVLLDRTVVDHRAHADAQQLEQLVGMGPSAHHDRAERVADVEAAHGSSVTISVDVLALGHS